MRGSCGELNEPATIHFLVPPLAVMYNGCTQVRLWTCRNFGCSKRGNYQRMRHIFHSSVNSKQARFKRHNGNKLSVCVYRLQGKITIKIASGGKKFKGKPTDFIDACDRHTWAGMPSLLHCTRTGAL